MPDNSIIHNAISELRNKWGFSCAQIIDGVEVVCGRSTFDPVIKSKANRHVDDIEHRPKRKKHSKAYYQHLYDQAKGNCIRFSKKCTGRLLTPAKRNVIDHIDPNAPPETWDTRANHQLICPTCNAEKSSKSVMEQAKESGMTIAEIVSRGFDICRENKHEQRETDPAT